MNLKRAADTNGSDPLDRDTIHEFISLFPHFGTVEDATYFLQAAPPGLIRINECIGDLALIEITTDDNGGCRYL